MAFSNDSIIFIDLIMYYSRYYFRSSVFDVFSLFIIIMFDISKRLTFDTYMKSIWVYVSNCGYNEPVFDIYVNIAKISRSEVGRPDESLIFATQFEFQSIHSVDLS